MKLSPSQQKEFNAFMQEVYDIDDTADRSTAYIIQHLTDTVYEWYNFQEIIPPSIGEINSIVMEFLKGGIDDEVESESTES